MGKFINEFKEFAVKGNMIDMAVGIIIGGAFNSLVSTLVNDVIMPLLSILTGKIDFSGIFTATEGAGVAVLYCLILSVIYRNLTLKGCVTLGSMARRPCRACNWQLNVPTVTLIMRCVRGRPPCR